MVCTFVFKPICFLNAKFWPFWPIWAMLPRIYTLFGAFLQVEIIYWTNMRCVVESTLFKVDARVFRATTCALTIMYVNDRRRLKSNCFVVLCTSSCLTKIVKMFYFERRSFCIFRFFRLSFFWSCPFEDVKW